MGKKVIHAELAEIMGVAKPTITRYHRAGMPIYKLTGRGKANLYDTEDVIMWWIDNEIAKRFGNLDENENAIDKDHEQARLARANADGKEIDNQERKRELASVTVMAEIIGKVGSQISAVLDSIPQKIKRRVPSLTANDIELIKKEIVKTQNAAAAMEVNLEEHLSN